MKFRDYFLLAILSLFLFATHASSQELRLCVANYALTHDRMNYPEHVRQTTGVGPFISAWLYNTFGENLNNAKKELARPEVIGTEVAFANTTCLNNNNCANYEMLYGYTNDSFGKAIDANDPKLWQKIDPHAQKLSNFLKENLRPNQKCYINPFLEGKINRERFTKFTNHIAPFFGGRCEFVWNPQGGNPGKAQPPAEFSEGHGASPKFVGRCIANPDGTSIPEGEYPGYLSRYGRQCEFACTWLPNNNCRNHDTAPAPHPRARTCKDTSDFKRNKEAMVRARKIKPVPVWDDEDNKSLEGCAKVHPTNDGDRKGFLSKPSDAAHFFAWTVLFPRVVDGQKKPINYKKVQAFSKGKPLYDWATPGLYTEDKSHRAIWRACKSAVPLGGCKNPVDAPKNVVIKASLDGKTKWQCWKIPDPAARND